MSTTLTLLRIVRVGGGQHAEPHQFEEARVDDACAGRPRSGRCRRSSRSCRAFGSPSLVSRRKYGLAEYGPLAVAVQPFTCARQASAVAGSGVRRRGVAVVPGDRRRADQPGDLAGDGGGGVAALVLPPVLRRPRRGVAVLAEAEQEVRRRLDVPPGGARRCGAVDRPARSGRPPRPAADRSRTACRRRSSSAGTSRPVSAACRTGSPAPGSAPARSPSAISAVAISYRSRDQTRWYGPVGFCRAPRPRHGRRGDVRAAVDLVLARGQDHAPRRGTPARSRAVCRLRGRRREPGEVAVPARGVPRGSRARTPLPRRLRGPRAAAAPAAAKPSVRRERAGGRGRPVSDVWPVCTMLPAGRTRSGGPSGRSLRSPPALAGAAVAGGGRGEGRPAQQRAGRVRVGGHQRAAVGAAGVVGRRCSDSVGSYSA